MPSSLVTQLERDALLIRTLLQIRATLFAEHAATARLLSTSEILTLDHRPELRAVDAALRVLGAPPKPLLPDDVA